MPKSGRGMLSELPARARLLLRRPSLQEELPELRLRVQQRTLRRGQRRERVQQVLRRFLRQLLLGKQSSEQLG